MTARLLLPMILASVMTGAAGCAFGMRFSAISPGVNQTLRVENGDRLFFDLAESNARVHEWDFKCDDKDVTVSIAHKGDIAHVELRIHRGYDGPSKVVFFRRGLHGKESERFILTLFRRTGDTAFWE